MTYIVKINYNNSYRCSCGGRQDWIENERFDTKEELVEFIADFEFQRKHYKELQKTNGEPYGINPDTTWIEDIVEIKDDFNFEAHVKEEAQKLIPELEKKHGVDETSLRRKSQQKKYREKKVCESRERRQLEKLKAKYG